MVVTEAVMAVVASVAWVAGIGGGGITTVLVATVVLTQGRECSSSSRRHKQQQQQTATQSPIQTQASGLRWQVL